MRGWKPEFACFQGLQDAYVFSSPSARFEGAPLMAVVLIRNGATAVVYLMEADLSDFLRELRLVPGKSTASQWEYARDSFRARARVLGRQTLTFDPPSTAVLNGYVGLVSMQGDSLSGTQNKEKKS